MALTDVFTYNQHFVAMMNVINAARLNPPESGHKHHIIPKCWFKMNNLSIDNSKDNLVLLSYEDHVKVHKLAMLCAATPEMKSKMAFAVKRLLKGHFGGMHHTEESLIKMSEHHKGKIFTEEHRRKLSKANSGKNNPFYGKTHSDVIRKKMSEALKGRTFTDETRRKLSESLKGKRKGIKFSEEHCRKLSESHKGHPMSEATRKALYEANKGRKHSVDTCKKRSDSLKGRVFSDETKQKLSAAKKGKSWKLIDGKRVWCNKNEVNDG